MGRVALPGRHVVTCWYLSAWQTRYSLLLWSTLEFLAPVYLSGIVSTHPAGSETHCYEISAGSTSGKQDVVPPRHLYDACRSANGMSSEFICSSHMVHHLPSQPLQLLRPVSLLFVVLQWCRQGSFEDP